MSNLKFLRNLKKNHKLIPYLEELISDGDSVEGFQFDYHAKVSDDAFHPSGDCTSTVAELVAKVRDPEYVPDWLSGMSGKSLNKTFMVGHFWHAYLQHILVYGELAAEEAIEVNRKVYWGDRPYEWATGSADVAPCQIPEEGDFVIDFKTMGSHQYKQNDIPEWAAAKYEAQLSIYMEWFNIDRGIIVAINKDGPHDMKEFEFERNPDLVDAVMAKWELATQVVYDDLVVLPEDEEILEISQYCKGPIKQ